MSGISYKDLISDLSHILISYIEPMGLKFTLGGEEIYLHEVFGKEGCLSLFLYDKQAFIDYFLRYKTVNGGDEAKAKIVLTFDPLNTQLSYFGMIYHIEHNLINFMSKKLNSHLYDELLYSLASKILNDKDLVIKGKTVELDEKYKDFISYLNPNKVLQPVDKSIEKNSGAKK